jgi:hypothetical protein
MNDHMNKEAIKAVGNGYTQLDELRGRVEKTPTEKNIREYLAMWSDKNRNDEEFRWDSIEDLEESLPWKGGKVPEHLLDMTTDIWRPDASSSNSEAATETLLSYLEPAIEQPMEINKSINELQKEASWESAKNYAKKYLTDAAWTKGIMAPDSWANKNFDSIMNGLAGGTALAALYAATASRRSNEDEEEFAQRRSRGAAGTLLMGGALAGAAPSIYGYLKEKGNEFGKAIEEKARQEEVNNKRLKSTGLELDEVPKVGDKVPVDDAVKTDPRISGLVASIESEKKIVKSRYDEVVGSYRSDLQKYNSMPSGPEKDALYKELMTTVEQKLRPMEAQMNALAQELPSEIEIDQQNVDGMVGSLAESNSKTLRHPGSSAAVGGIGGYTTGVGISGARKFNDLNLANRELKDLAKQSKRLYINELMPQVSEIDEAMKASVSRNQPFALTQYDADGGKGTHAKNTNKLMRGALKNELAGVQQGTVTRNITTAPANTTFTLQNSGTTIDVGKVGDPNLKSFSPLRFDQTGAMKPIAGKSPVLFQTNAVQPGVIPPTGVEGVIRPNIDLQAEMSALRGRNPTGGRFSPTSHASSTESFIRGLSATPTAQGSTALSEALARNARSVGAIRARALKPRSFVKMPLALGALGTIGGLAASTMWGGSPMEDKGKLLRETAVKGLQARMEEKLRAGSK